MNKEFIPYVEALALKELGFDEPCFGYYDNTGKLFFNTNGQPVGKDWVWEGNQIVPTDMVLVPTFSQAFRWFREKHHLIGGIEYIGGATPETTWWDIYVIGHFNINPSEWTMKYQPYEEAELACLNKLIEIVKGGEQ